MTAVEVETGRTRRPARMTERDLTLARVREYRSSTKCRSFRKFHQLKKSYVPRRVKFSALALEKLQIPKRDRERGGYMIADRHGGSSKLVLWDGHRNVQQFAAVFLEVVE